MAYKLLINGELVDAAEGASEDILGPDDEKVLARVPTGSYEDVDRAAKAAAAAQEAWAEMPVSDRARALLKLADRLEEHTEELARLESENVGKPLALARWEVPFMADNLRFFAGACRCMEGKPANC